MRSILHGITLGCAGRARKAARSSLQHRTRFTTDIPPYSDDIEILDACVNCLRLAVEATSKADPTTLGYLGEFLAHRYMLLARDEDLNDAITTLQSAIDRTSESDQDMPMRFDALGLLLQQRFERLDEPIDLETALALQQRAVALAPDTHSDRALLLHHLGYSQQLRFEHSNAPQDLAEAISTLRSSVELTPGDNPNMPARLRSLCRSLLSRHTQFADDKELQTIISMLRRAYLLLPESHPDRFDLQDELDTVVQRRYEALGLAYDFKHAAAFDRQRSAKLFPDGGAVDVAKLRLRGLLLQEEYERFGNPADLDAAISVARRAVGLTPEDHPDQPLLLNSLGNYLRDRFGREGALDDLESAIRLHRLAIKLIPSGHDDIPLLMHNLSVCLQGRYERLQELDDIEAAINLDQRAVELVSDDEPDKAVWLNGLGIVLLARYKRIRKREDLDMAITVLRQAVDLTPGYNSHLPSRLVNLGNAHQRRYAHFHELHDVKSAIAAQRRALKLTSDSHPSKPSRLNSYGASLQSRYELLHELDDLDAAISAHRRAAELTPSDGVDKSMWLNNLGIALEKRFDRTQTQSDFDATIESFMAAAAQSSASPYHRMSAASGCLSLLNRYPQFRSPDRLLQAHSHVISLLPELMWLGHNVERRYEEAAKLRGFANTAVAGAISVGALQQAVVWLEQGRALVWSQVLAMRTPLDDLAQQDKDLADALRELQSQLQASGHHSMLLDRRSENESILGMVSDARDPHRQLVIQYERLLAQARSYPGLENFMRPQTFADAVQSIKLIQSDGPVVFINIDMHRCDALILSTGSSDIKLVQLPNLSEKRAYQLHSLWRNCLASCGVLQRAAVSPSMALRGGLSRLEMLLERLWTWVVEPILRQFKLDGSEGGEQLPHVTWCPTGPLTQLPLHAAGLYSQKGGPRAFNLVVSSYTPSLSALMRSHEGLAKKSVDPKVLIVTQPHTPKLSALPGTVTEGNRLRQLLAESHTASTTFNDKEATVDSVRGVIDQHAWVHLACHGSQHLADPTKSAFALYDGPLSLADLMSTAAENAELAFLSACQTAVGDHKIPEESAHLAAGMLAVGFKGVVATMWSIGDADAPVVVQEYYTRLLESMHRSASGARSTGAAYALHEAMKRLREKVGEKEFIRWAPFVHFGV
ncbi:unnamed protein product [Peniophora sp. CBMAI 1063]|nr:unnamed protein product [Peniophora sp. CBMAI 1063]